MPETPATIQTAFRLTAEDRAKLTALRAHYNLATDVAVLRFLLEKEHKKLPKTRKPE